MVVAGWGPHSDSTRWVSHRWKKLAVGKSMAAVRSKQDGAEHEMVKKPTKKKKQSTDEDD
jgi:hypothetical protein